MNIPIVSIVWDHFQPLLWTERELHCWLKALNIPIQLLSIKNISGYNRTWRWMVNYILCERHKGKKILCETSLALCYIFILLSWIVISFWHTDNSQFLRKNWGWSQSWFVEQTQHYTYIQLWITENYWPRAQHRQAHHRRCWRSWPRWIDGKTRI